MEKKKEEICNENCVILLLQNALVEGLDFFVLYEMIKHCHLCWCNKKGALPQKISGKTQLHSWKVKK